MRGLIVDLERNEEEVGLNEGQHIGIDACLRLTMSPGA